MTNLKNRVEVEIYGERYTLVGDADTESMVKMSAEVDEKLKQVLKRNARLSPYKAAVLVALNTLEELHKLREEYDSLVQLLESERVID